MMMMMIMIPRLVMLAGMVADVSAVPLKAFPPILVTMVGIVIDDNALQ